MITKEQYLNLVKKEWGNRATHHRPDPSNILFRNEFMSFLEKDFIRQDEIINITYSYNCGKGRFFDSWDENTFVAALKCYVSAVVRAVIMRDSFTVQEYWVITKGICAILENGIVDEWLKDDNVPFDDKYKGFYVKGDKYGFYGMPLYLLIMKHYGWLDLLDVNPYEGYGFDNEKEVVFDMSQWKTRFKNSKQITMLKNEYDTGWTEDDWTYNEDGTLNDNENCYHYYDRETKSYRDGKTPHNYYDRYMYQIRLMARSNCLRKVDTGASYIAEAIETDGYVVAFNGIYPIKKLKTSLGFSFYKQSGFWSDGVFCDDINIKKVVFPISKPTNLELMDHPREFIVYNEQTGYWVLPKLIYPVKFKTFIKDILKKNSKTIGKWSDTCVFADSRTLCGDTYHFDIAAYPDIEDKKLFQQVFEKSIRNRMKKQKQLMKYLNEVGAKINLTIPETEDILKELNVITQEDINNFCNPNQELEIKIEKYV